ncbi:MAG TPA: tetratricopeptide repeat protein [Thermodesulfobacteriota bacterium]|nr:tetratricopeptide repeat protein [Thermodesulfobacteriota bacterium]
MGAVRRPAAVETGLLALLLCGVPAGCQTTALPPVTAPAFRFEEDEQRLWRRAEEEQARLERSGLVHDDAALEGYLNEVARRLLPPAARDVLPVQVRVVRNPYLNAFAFPTGRVYVHSGILARMESEAELAALLAHELTHATHRHAVRQFRGIKNATAVLASIQVSLVPFGALGDLAGLLGAIGAVAAVTGYSRELETEADTEGFRLLLAAGYDPAAAPALFQHLREELDEDRIREPFFFGTHPRLAERIENFHTLLAAAGGPRGGLRNEEAFLARTARLVLDNARLDLRAGRFSRAERGVRKYLRLAPADPEGPYALGEVFRQRGGAGDAERAQQAYRGVLALDPGHAGAHRGLGLVLLKQGDRAGARGFLERYLALAPQAPDRAYIEAYLGQAER